MLSIYCILILMNLPIELWQLILSCSEFLTQIKLRCVCKMFHKRLEVHIFMGWRYTDLLTDDILQNYPFIKKLNASNNPHITTVNHMSRLEILYAQGNCGIDDKGIQNANLKELRADSNPRITTVNHMSRLEILNAGWNCGIDDKGIQNANLKELRANSNPRITTVNHMSRLEILDAQGNCGIDDIGIQNANLKKLYASNNPRITTV